MNRKEFQEWLEQFPEDTEIEVVIQTSSRNYESYGRAQSTTFVGDELTDHEYVDFTGNQFVQPTDSFFEKKILTLGQSC